jgi:hypothetical protein
VTESLIVHWSDNGIWQAKVGVRFQFGSLRVIEDQSRRFVTALRRRRARRIESAPERGVFPKGRKLDLQRTLHGRMINLRRTDGSGAVGLLGRRAGGL